MTQSYTGNVICTIQSIDNVSLAAIFNHAITNAVNPNGISSSFVNGNDLSGTQVVYGAPGAYGIYIKNLGPVGTISVIWTSSGVTITPIVLMPGTFILIFDPNGATSLSYITVTASQVLSAEWASWA